MKTSEKLKKTSERVLRFIGKNRQEKNKCFDGNNKMKLTLELLAGFSLSLIWLYFPLVPNVCKYLSLAEIFTMYLKMCCFTWNSVNVIFFVKFVILLLFFSLSITLKLGEEVLRGCWNGPRTALNKTKSEKSSGGFDANSTEGAYSIHRRGVLSIILPKLWSCEASSKVLQLQRVGPILS